MFGSEVTISASSERADIASRTAWRRRSSAVLGACDMNGVEILLQRGDGVERPRASRIGNRSDGSQRRCDRDLRGQPIDQVLQLGIVARERESGPIVSQRVRCRSI